MASSIAKARVSFRKAPRSGSRLRSRVEIIAIPNRNRTLLRPLAAASGAKTRGLACPVWYRNGALGEIRTPDPRIRSPMLYPAELRARESFQRVSNDTKFFGSFLALVVAATFRLVRQQVALSARLFKAGNRSPYAGGY